VQRGAFGACLMAEPLLVADCVKAIQDAVTIPATVKHRIGIDHCDDYGFVRDFVGALHAAGCGVFIVHARSAWLKGLSPKENREVPPLDYSCVHRLQQDFPSAQFVLNGGIATLSSAREHLDAADGVMRDLQRTCACCNEKGQCERDLLRRPEDALWQSYCPNATTLDAVVRLKNQPMTS
jgi:tRNA-dihydrouridine synthase A